jgi:hypothetical protein
MNKLFLFGDSFTFGYGCTENEEFALKYKTPDDLLWFEIVSNKFNLEIVNHGMGLYSNDKIIDSIINVYDDIGKDDYVLIQKGFTHRFDMPNLDDNFLITIAPSPRNLLTKDFTLASIDYTEDEIKSIEYMVVTLDSKLIEDRQTKRLNFLKKIIENKKVKKCILWDIENYTERNVYERIVDATNGEINDHHWSFKGHKLFAEKIIKLLKDPNPII